VEANVLVQSIGADDTLQWNVLGECIGFEHWGSVTQCGLSQVYAYLGEMKFK
jgi:hypothetical protein